MIIGKRLERHWHWQLGIVFDEQDFRTMYLIGFFRKKTIYSSRRLHACAFSTFFCSEQTASLTHNIAHQISVFANYFGFRVPAICIPDFLFSSKIPPGAKKFQLQNIIPRCSEQSLFRFSFMATAKYFCVLGCSSSRRNREPQSLAYRSVFIIIGFSYYSNLIGFLIIGFNLIGSEKIAENGAFCEQPLSVVSAYGVL